MFQGNRVVNQSWEEATFLDMGSAPALLDAARACDFHGLTSDNEIEQADAIQAYVQADMRGNVWVCLPPEARPKWWPKYERPVVKLKKALYGHPDSGTFWEDHCTEKVRSVGFQPLPDEWKSCFWHPQWKAFFVVYVDDFKLSGPKGDPRENLEGPRGRWPKDRAGHAARSLPGDVSTHSSHNGVLHR